MMVLVLMAVTVSFTLGTRRSTLQFTLQVALHCLSHVAAGSRGGLYPESLKELNSPTAHTPAEHHVRLLLLDETRHLAWLMRRIKGVLDDLDRLDLILLHLHQRKKWAAPKMMGNLTFQSLVCVR
jgi:hypothetical protein